MSRIFTTDEARSSGTPVTAMPFTLACWANLSNDSSKQILMALGASSSSTLVAILRAAGNVGGDPVHATLNVSGEQTAATSTGYTAGVWFHAVAVFATTTSRIAYIDGGNSGENTEFRNPGAFDEVIIGSEPDGTFPLDNGRVAEAGLWNVALTPAEVAVLAGGISPRFIRPSALVGYWPLFGVGSPEPDYSGGTAYNLTLSGTAVGDHPPVMLPFGYDVGWQGISTSGPAPGDEFVTNLIKASSAAP